MDGQAGWVQIYSPHLLFCIDATAQGHVAYAALARVDVIEITAYRDWQYHH